MCGRFTITTPLRELAEAFDLDDVPPALEPRWNVAPTQGAPVVRRVEDRRRLELVRWGLVPAWAKDLRIGARMINARAETAATLPAFREAFARRRCLVLASGFYEWRRVGSARRPLLLRRPDGGPFAMAGLWERWRAPDGEAVETCAVLTTAASATVSAVHDRMPALLLGREAWAAWLAPGAATDALRALLAPAAEDALVLVPLSSWVNDVHHEGPRCHAPPEDEGPGPVQLELFG